MTNDELIAAWNTRAYLNHDGLPMGLTISDDDNLLNWRGENYVKQGTLGNGTLTAEQVREAVEASTWAETSTIREFNDSSWQAIADDLNAELGSGTRDELATVKAERDNLADDLLASNREREHLRRTLGIALDHAHDVLALVNLDGEVVS